MKQAAPQSPQLETFSVRLEPELAQRLRAKALAEDRPIAAHIRRLIRDDVGDEDQVAA